MSPNGMLDTAKIYEHDRDGYTDAKTDFIREITNRAKEQITYPTNME